MAAETELTKYICLFHSRDHAGYAEAIRDLETAGFSRGALTIINGNDSSTNSASGSTGSASSSASRNETGYGSDSGYSGSGDLESLGVPSRDRKHLQDGLDGGGVVLGLEAEGDRADEIERIFHKHTAAKIDETEEPNDGRFAAPMAAAASPVNNAAQDSISIPVVDEELVVGKQNVDRGGVRVFRRVVEEPVSESVSLREEHAVVERRPVDRAVTDADLRAGDRTIELKETAEEAVVAKSARVVEEVRVGKQASEHTETIRDTVRHTEVDVESVEGVAPSDTPRQTY